jgi:hypothetical protein
MSVVKIFVFLGGKMVWNSVFKWEREWCSRQSALVSTPLTNNEWIYCFVRLWEMRTGCIFVRSWHQASQFVASMRGFIPARHQKSDGPDWQETISEDIIHPAHTKCRLQSKIKPRVHSNTVLVNLTVDRTIRIVSTLTLYSVRAWSQWH